MLRIRRPVLGLSAVASIALAAPARAQDQVEAQVLPALEVVVTDSAGLQILPGASTVITRQEIQRADPISSNEMFRLVPGLHVQDEDNMGLNLNIGIRGLNPRRSSRVLLLEDGAPIHLGPYSDPSMHYAPPVESLDRIEVLKGASQILHGPQTVAGVVNFVTMPPRSQFGGTLMLGAGNRDFLNGQLNIGGKSGNTPWSLDYVHREGEGTRQFQRHSLDNLSARALFNLSPSQQLLLKGTFFRERSAIGESGLTQEEFEENPFGSLFRNDRFNVDRYGAQAIHSAQLGKRSKLLTSAYFAYTDRASWRQSGESEERLDEGDYNEEFNCQPGATTYQECGNQGRPRQYTFGGIEPRFELGWGSGSMVSQFTAGARLHLEDVRRRQYLGNTPTSRQDDATLTRHNELATTAVAAYVQNTFGFGQFSVTPGVRLENVRMVNENLFPGSEARDEDNYTQVLPGVGATFDVHQAATLFAGAHRGFAPPRPADIFSAEPGEPLVFVDPETSWTFELGARARPVLGLNLEATLFQLDFSNEIIENPASEGQRFINGGQTRHQGLELSGTLSSAVMTGSRNDVYAQLAYTNVWKAEFTDGDQRPEVVGNRLPYAPKSLFSGAVGFQLGMGFGLRANVEYVSEQFGDEDNTVEPSDDGQDGILPAYTVFGAVASYAFPKTPVTLRAAVKNLGNTVYITDRSEGIQVGMPRTFMAEVVWSF